MFGIAIKNIDIDCEKEIKISCEEKTKLFFDQENNSIEINPGIHNIIIKRHHDFFFDWFVDGKLIEEFLIYHLVFDEENSIIIQSEKKIEIVENENYKEEICFEQCTCFPYIIELLDLSQVNILCEKPSQLSFFFQQGNQKESRGSSFKTLTLYFTNEGYCKFYLDEYEDNVYLKDKRKNLSLFQTKIGINNIFQFNKQEQKITIYNSEVKIKEYKLENLFENYNYLCIEETYKPDGPGKYVIEKV